MDQFQVQTEGRDNKIYYCERDGGFGNTGAKLEFPVTWMGKSVGGGRFGRRKLGTK